MFPEVFRLQKPDVNTREGYEQTHELLAAWEAGMEEHRTRYRNGGATPDEIERLMAPMAFLKKLVRQLETST